MKTREKAVALILSFFVSLALMVAARGDEMAWQMLKSPLPLTEGGKVGPRAFEHVRVVDVYDGDTFTGEVDLGFHLKIVEKFRLAKVDTPEVKSRPGHPASPLGPVVRDYVSSLILDHEICAIVWGEEGRGRWLATVLCKVDGKTVDLGAHLVATGRAVSFMEDSKIFEEEE